MSIHLGGRQIRDHSLKSSDLSLTSVKTHLWHHENKMFQPLEDAWNVSWKSSLNYKSVHVFSYKYRRASRTHLITTCNGRSNYIKFHVEYFPIVTSKQRLDGPGIETRWGRDFLRLSRPVVGPTQPPIQWVSVPFPGGKVAGAWRWPPTPI
jgi:hypothetical protein